VNNFASDDVTLIAGTNTNYTFVFNQTFVSILNVTDSKSFSIIGGTFILSGGISCYFCWVDGGGALLSISFIELLFTDKMNSFIFVLGGTVSLKSLKLENELINWVYPLVDINQINFPVVVEISACNITNCTYIYNKTTTPHKSGVVFFTNISATESITLNMSSCNFFKNNMSIGGTSVYGGGAVCYFWSRNISSGFFFF
jgi:hypothetical protein